jgi:FAD-dependent oxidoreductase domain-containing protein 1
MARYDVVIVGGAIVGSALAYYLRREGFPGTVALVERDPLFTRSSTTLSCASIRQQFSIPENIRLSRWTLGLFRRLTDEFGRDADIGFRENGYLMLASPEGLGVLEANHRVQEAEGADIVLEDPQALSRRFPWMSTEGVAAGAWGRTGEGWFDAHALLALFRKALRTADVAMIHDTVTAIGREGSRVTAVTLASGERLEAGAVVNAAGPGGGRVAAMAGIPLPVEGRKRTVFVFDAAEKQPAMPLVIDPSGIYFRPEGSVYLAGGAEGLSDEAPTDPDDFEPEWTQFEDGIWPILASRVPAFEAVKLVRAWAGHYDYNLLDQNAVIGPHPEVENFLFANGFSGHGLQQAAAVGKSLAELITHGAYRTVDCAAFGYARIAANRPFREMNII